MKKTYDKPVAVKREKLAAVTAEKELPTPGTPIKRRS